MTEIYYVIDKEPIEDFYIDNPNGDIYPTITIVSKEYWVNNECICEETDELGAVLDTLKESGCYFMGQVTLVMEATESEIIERMYDKGYVLSVNEEVTDYYFTYMKEGTLSDDSISLMDVEFDLEDCDLF